MTRVVALLAVALLLAGCGAEVATEPGSRSAGPDLLRTQYAVMVLDDGDGAELCLGGVNESYPPQCGGPPITNWVWADHAGDFEDDGGVKWGDFQVVGTYDGERFTTTEVVPGGEVEEPAAEPEGPGWVMPCDDLAVADPDRLTRQAFEAGASAAHRLDSIAWVRVEGSEGDVTEWAMDVRVTDDLAGAEAAIREHWGGMLCVSEAEHAESELMRIQRVVADRPDHLGSGTDLDHVDLYVIHDAGGELQAEMDATYGEGLVEVGSALVPSS